MVASVAIATIAFWAYTQTLLPGVDLGDTGGFQAAVLWPEVSARQAYPLYYGLARPFVGAVSAVNPARGLNLFSAIWGAAAVGLLTFLCAMVSGSLASGVVAGTLLAFSYTFWSQAIIAEVYTLHLAIVLACCLALYAYAACPTRARLALFFAVYAIGFGNHLSMILLFVPFSVFLLQVTPNRHTLFNGATIALAIGIAIAGALQYWPNFMSTAHTTNGGIVPFGDRVANFWFDTTKADWRDTMVLGVREDQLTSRFGMWWFDARQQFGIAGLALAVIGAVRLWTISKPWAALVILGYAINTLFAFTYNVGDTHVFYLPSHLFAALAAGVAVGQPGGSERTRPTLHIAGPVLRIAAIAAIALAAWRAWDTWPAIDRHDDRRAEALVARLALGVNPQTSVLVTNVNWQLENALLYYSRWERRDIPWVRLPDVEPHFPLLVRDNEAVSRDLVLDRYSAREVVSAFGPLFPMQPDPIRASSDLIDEISGLPPSTPYVLCVLTPPREETLDPQMLETTIRTLTGGKRDPRIALKAGGVGPRGPAYQMMAGLTGEAPEITRAEDHPFRQEFRLLDDPFTVRMESWLPSDTFRRAGFGRVIRGREHVLTLERGINLVWFDRNARPSNAVYAASIYAPGERYRISSVSPALARLLQQGWYRRFQ